MQDVCNPIHIKCQHSIGRREAKISWSTNSGSRYSFRNSNILFFDANVSCNQVSKPPCGGLCDILKFFSIQNVEHACYWHDFLCLYSVVQSAENGTWHGIYCSLTWYLSYFTIPWPSSSFTHASQNPKFSRCSNQLRAIDRICRVIQSKGNFSTSTKLIKYIMICESRLNFFCAIEIHSDLGEHRIKAYTATW